jgi:hypothetical protein
MHTEVAEKTSLARQRAIDRINAKVGVRPCKFQTGDFVLRGVLPRHQLPKLALRWVGPYRIVQVLTGFIFILQHLITGDKGEVHGSRMLFFRNSDYDVTKEIIEHLEYRTGELHTVSEFVDVRVWQGSVEVRARWRGHEAWEDTWGSVKAMRMTYQYFFKITWTPRVRAGLLSRGRFSSSITSNTHKGKLHSFCCSPWRQCCILLVVLL